jgi:Uma2 family endonuclease
MPSTRITWHDALQAPDDGKRYEAIEGALFVTPAPSVRHQWISFNLERELDRWLVRPGYGLVFHAPVGVEFPGSEEGVQPDILFVSTQRLDIVHDDWIRGAPDLIVEILSPATAERDRDLKRKLYQRQGVAEYWIVDPESESIQVWRLAAGATTAEAYLERVPVRVAGQNVGTIELAGIFPPRR